MTNAAGVETEEETDPQTIDVTRHAWQVRLERWRRVPRYGRTRGEIEDAAARYARTLGDEVAVVSARAPALGHLAYWSGQVLGWGGGLLALFGLLTLRSPDLDDAVFGPFGIGVVAFAVSGALVRLGRRLLRPSAAELRAADRRRPVLLLSSFRRSDTEILTGVEEGTGADEVGSVAATVAPPSTAGAHAELLEESIGQAFVRYGPVTALRAWNEQASRPGAFGEARWDSMQAGLLDQAVLLVALPAAGGPDTAEIEAVIRRRHAHKLLILMPPLDGVWPWETSTGRATAASASRRRNAVEQALAWRPRSSAAAAWDRTKQRLRSPGETAEALRLARWATIRETFKDVPGFANLPRTPPRRALAVHLVRGEDAVFLTGPKVPAASDYLRAVAFAVYGMKCHGNG